MTAYRVVFQAMSEDDHPEDIEVVVEAESEFEATEKVRDNIARSIYCEGEA